MRRVVIAKARNRIAAVAAIVALGLSLAVGVAPATADASATDASAASTVPAPAVQQASSSVADTGVVKSADLSKFKPGNIISDGVFFNGNTMSAADIQSFLNGKVASCQSGYVCLKDFRQTTRDEPADAYCSGYRGGANETAATIIAKVAASCGVNPQVLLVTLQKEQALVTHTWPSDWRYKSAMGQGCPDTAACDSRYYGFQNQVYGAARQFKIYAEGRYFTWYAPGKTWNIQYHPNKSCGSSPVYIENKATAGLYYYTPYQPNAAALRAGYGEGDGCSSYGNRNFYQYFQDWFGSTGTSGDTLQVLRVSGTNERYLVSQGQRWKLGTDELAGQFTWISSVRDVARSVINGYQDKGGAKRAVRTTSGIVWLLDSGARFRLQDCGQVADFGWDCGTLPLASDAQVNRYRDGGWLQRVVKDGRFYWLLQGGKVRQVVDLSILPRYGIPATSTAVSNAMRSEYKISDPVITVGVYRDSSNPYRFVTDAGVYGVPDAASGTAIARSARELSAGSFKLLKSSSTMPVRVTAGKKSYVMVDDGWLQVDKSQYPASLGFSSVPAGAISALPVVGNVSIPHFIRERSSGQTYLVSWGTLQAVSPAEQAWVTAVYGVSPRVWPVLDGVIAEATTAEGMVRTSNGVAYLLDGARAYQFRDCAQVSAWGGNCGTLPVISASKLAGYAQAGYLQHLVQTPAGTIWLPQGGAMRQVLDPGILAVYGIPSATSSVSAKTVSSLPVGEPALAAGVYSDGGNGRVVVTTGGEYSLTADQRIGVVNTAARKLTSASFKRISVDGAMPSRMRSDKRSFVLTTEGWLEVSAAEYGSDTFTQIGAKGWTGIGIVTKETRPHFIRNDASGANYLVSGGAVQPVGGESDRTKITETYGVPPKVWRVAPDVLAGLKVRHDLLIKVDGKPYLIDGTTRYAVPNCDVVRDLGGACDKLRTLTAAQLSDLKDGGTLAALLKSAVDGRIWLAQSGKKREVPDSTVLSVYGIGTATTTVSAETLNHFGLGEPVVGVGVFSDDAGDVRLVTGDGRVFTLPESRRIGSVAANAKRLTPASIDLLKAEGDLPLRVQTGSAYRVLTTEGWLQVDPAAYAPLKFTSIGARGGEGVRSAGSETRPHFVREQSGNRVYLASGGLTEVADQATLNWIATTYGVPTKVWVVADGALR